MAFDTANLVLEDLVIETSLEFTLASGSCRDIHGGLTTTEDHIILLGSDSGAVQRCVGNVGLQDGEVTRGHELQIVNYQF